MPGKPCSQKRARVPPGHVLDVAGLAHDTALHIQIQIQKKPFMRKKKTSSQNLVPFSSTFAMAAPGGGTTKLKVGVTACAWVRVRACLIAVCVCASARLGGGCDGFCRRARACSALRRS
jgi:hypothetical protein